MTARTLGSRRLLALAASALVSAAALVSLPGSAATGAESEAPAPAVTLQGLTSETSDPTNIEVARDGRVIWTERLGALMIRQPNGKLVVAGTVPVSANACVDCESAALEEGGLHGLLLARDFVSSGKVYLYYSAPGTRNAKTREGQLRLSSFIVRNNKLDLRSEKVLLKVPAGWDECCHYGGDLEWLPDGTILLTTGDDTNPHASSGYSPTDQRPGRDEFNALRTAGNPKDLRGKVLRLNPDGSVPRNNPFLRDKRFNPYVYAMGFRSPYKMAVSAATGTTYVGNVGPDATVPHPLRGPEGHDELETIPPRGGTKHGWPFCIADNKPYYEYDYASSVGFGLPFVPEVGGLPGPQYSCEGMQPATLYYTHTNTYDWPELGNGGRTAIAGVVYEPRVRGALSPKGWAGSLVMLEFSRDKVLTLPIGRTGKLDTTKLVDSGLAPNGPIDAAVGPDGAVYIAEYGSAFYENTDSRISRIVCSGCKASAADYRAAAPAPAAGSDVVAAPAAPEAATSGEAPASRTATAARRATQAAPAEPASSSTRPIAGLVVAVLLALGVLGAWRSRRVA